MEFVGGGGDAVVFDQASERRNRDGDEYGLYGERDHELDQGETAHPLIQGGACGKQLAVLGIRHGVGSGYIGTAKYCLAGLRLSAARGMSGSSIGMAG